MESNNEVKWPEIFSLGALSAAIAISWIAYHEYQPVLLQDFDFHHLSDFLVITKALVLVLTPALAGLLADHFMSTKGKYFIIFTVGIGATAMIFMIVASIIGAGPASGIEPFLPYMIVLWLISMNLFISPAYSMIESFAPMQKLPIVMGFVFMVTELIYALEPLVVELVLLFGDTLTFIVGGVLISGTGFIFHKISSNEVKTRRENAAEPSKVRNKFSLLAIVVVGLVLGLAKGMLVEYLPESVHTRFPELGKIGDFLSFGLMGLAALLAFLISRYVSKIGARTVLMPSFIIFILGSLLFMVSGNAILAVSGAVLMAVAFSLINVSGLPFAISQLSMKHITYGVGVYIGASEVFGGLFEIYLN